MTAPAYSVAITLHGRRGAYAEARALWDEMVACKTQLDASAFTSIMNAAACAGDIAEVEQHLQGMLAVGLRPNEAAFGCLMKACRVKGDPARGLEVLKQMRAQGVAPTVVQHTIAMAACRQALAAGGDRKQICDIVAALDAELAADGVVSNEYYLEERLSVALGGLELRDLAKDPQIVTKCSASEVDAAMALMAEADAHKMRRTPLIQQLHAALQRVQPAADSAVEWLFERPADAATTGVQGTFTHTRTGSVAATTPTQGWAEVRVAGQASPYYWNIATGATTWDRPSASARG